MKIHRYISTVLILMVGMVATTHSDSGNYEGRGGFHLGLMGREDPVALGGEVGGFVYNSNILSGNAGAAFLTSQNLEKIFGGFNIGMRASAPFRVSPYVGIGGFLGWIQKKVPAEDDDKDNDDDGSVDEDGETKTQLDAIMSSINPELGTHFWLGSNFRLTTRAVYNITTQGRNKDFWAFGFVLGFVSD